jgi:hypothetical protein
MTDRIKNIALVAASITALALGGSAIAGAASGGGSNNNSTSNSAQAAQRSSAGLPPQRADETLLTGDTAAQVRKAALAKVSGATIERVETDADGNATYGGSHGEERRHAGHRVREQVVRGRQRQIRPVNAEATLPC